MQAGFVKNRQNLEEHGILYPITGIRGYGHHLVASEMVRRKSINPFFSLGRVKELSRLKAEIDASPCPRALISSEAFQNCSPEVVRKAFAGYDLQVICYIRNKADYLVSAYAQKVHATNYAETIEHYWKKFFRLDYVKFVTQWEKAFPGRFNLRVFDRKHLLGGDVVADFFESFIPGRISRSPCDENMNPSLGYQLVTVKRAINIVYPDLGTDRDVYRFFSARARRDKQQKINIPYPVFAAVASSRERENEFLAPRLGIPGAFEYQYQAGANELDMEYIRGLTDEISRELSAGIRPEPVLEKIRELAP